MFPTTSRVNRLVVKKNFKIFVCGPTVYNYCHLGHARVFLFYDLVARFLRSQGMNVKFVMNITDIDPKISVQAKRYGHTPEKISERFSLELYSDLTQLGVTGISFAKVSDYVPMASQIGSKLLEKGFAYALNGNIYLDTSKIKSFGRMSSISKAQLKNVRFDLAADKRSPADLLLWMVALFEGTYQLHGGATDLVYPHHESILGQLIALTSLRRPVQCWTHVGLLRNKGSKMSNSLGNAIRIRRILRRYNPNIIRLYFLSEHYRRPMDFSESTLGRLEKLDKKISKAISLIRVAGVSGKDREDFAIMKHFIRYIENDFDTVGILTLLTDRIGKGHASAKFLEILQILGLNY